jgi:glycosyltransferase involved in cell wall biosynthesis
LYLNLCCEAFRKMGYTVYVGTHPDVVLSDAAGVRRLPAFETRGYAAFCEAGRLARSVGVKDVFFPFIDAVLRLPTRCLSGPRPADGPQRIHGIYMNPRAFDFLRLPAPACFLFGNYKRGWNGLRVLQRWAQQGSLGHLFVLDERLIGRTPPQLPDVSWFPDPWFFPARESRSEARAHLKLPQDRLILVHAGTGGIHRGLGDLVEALDRMPALRPLLVRAGKQIGVPKKTRPKLRALAAAGDFVHIDHWLDEDELERYLTAADYVALPYRRHLDSSGILVRACNCGTRVIASDYGLVGDRVRRWNAGYLFRRGSISDLKRCLERLPYPSPPFDGASIRSLFSKDAVVKSLAARFL